MRENIFLHREKKEKQNNDTPVLPQAWDGFTWKPPTATPLPTLPSPNITISGAMGGKSRPHPPSIQVGNSRRGKKNRSDRRRRRKERRRRRKSKSRRLR